MAGLAYMACLVVDLVDGSFQRLKAKSLRSGLTMSDGRRTVAPKHRRTCLVHSQQGQWETRCLKKDHGHLVPRWGHGTGVQVVTNESPHRPMSEDLSAAT